ncbi:hypothetical protein GCM10009779_08730 [Polymorphospora rubra]|uniref:Uncharacterized protein n=1 Tax=Polymorphospora rubra TaxID=338584 RepID=A0A810NCR8_9ACTN|nr:hypothetical protein Prubr_66890 [Polymorphospora rubra]
MTKPGEETADLLATVEEIRARDFADIDPKLVSEILATQHQFAEDRAEARKRTDQIINRWAARHLGSGASH